jgi:hypothetical protein
VISEERLFEAGSGVGLYWLSRCQGFRVQAGRRRLGMVEEVVCGLPLAGAELLVVRTRRRRRLVELERVVAVVPALRLVLVERRPSRVQRTFARSRGPLAGVARGVGPGLGTIGAAGAVCLRLIWREGRVLCVRLVPVLRGCLRGSVRLVRLLGRLALALARVAGRISLLAIGAARHALARGWGQLGPAARVLARRARAQASESLTRLRPAIRALAFRVRARAASRLEQIEPAVRLLAGHLRDRAATPGLKQIGPAAQLLAGRLRAASTRRLPARRQPPAQQSGSAHRRIPEKLDAWPGDTPEPSEHLRRVGSRRY